MAQTINGADGASIPTVSVSDKPNHTVEEMRAKFALNDEQSKLNFKKAKDALQKYRDPNQNVTSDLSVYSRDMIKRYLQDPGRNQDNLRKVAKYLFYRSQILYRLVNWYAGMWDLRCRNVKPKFDLLTGLDANALESYKETVEQLDRYNLQESLHEILINVYLTDICYFLWFRDETGAIPFVLDPQYCKVVGRYMTGDLAFAINIKAFLRSTTNRNLVEWIGEPFTTMQQIADRDNVSWVQVPEEYAGCLKFNIGDIYTNIPPFSPIFMTLSSLLGTEDLADVQAKLDVFKMIVMPIKTMKKNMNDWEIDPDMMLEYFDMMVKQALPSYVTAAPILGEGLDTIDFSNASTDAQVDRVASAQKNILSTSGGGAVLNAGMINSTIAFKTWLAEETEFAISPLIGQIDGFANRMLSYDVTNPCEVKHFELSVYTKADFRDAMLQANQYSFSYRLPLGTLYGISELATLAQMHFEQELLGLPGLMVHPLQSSYTSTGESDPDNEGGRPTVDDGEISDSGERSRNQ